MDSSVMGVIITQIGAILVASGGWYFGAKKDREKTRELMMKEIQDLKADVAEMGANLQQKIAIVELEVGHSRNDVNTLSNRVEKHNGVIERVFHLEDSDKLLDEKIKVANNRIADLERKVMN